MSIINIWSTPRTGSTWYGKYLEAITPGSTRINELFNNLGTTQYFYKTEAGDYLWREIYNPGCYYDTLRLNNGRLVMQPIYEKKPEIGIIAEGEYYLDLIRQRDYNRTVVIHNHVAPMPVSIRDQLMEVATENIFLYRRDKRLQLASMAITVATRKCNSLIKLQDACTPVPDIDPMILRALITRIKIWDDIPKNNAIAYEDIQFVDVPGVPLPQQMNDNHFGRLSKNMKIIIDKLVEEYENRN
jgi:hypothetical protein